MFAESNEQYSDKYLTILATSLHNFVEA